MGHHANAQEVAVAAAAEAWERHLLSVAALLAAARHGKFPVGGNLEPALGVRAIEVSRTAWKNEFRPTARYHGDLKTKEVFCIFLEIVI